MASRNKRTDEPRGITRIQAPSWLTQHVEEDTSTEAMQEYRVLPRVKVIQAMTDQVLKDAFGEASAIMSPGNELIITKDESFLFVPVFFFTEFCKWSDLKDKNNPTILERSFDKAGELARRSRNKDTRTEEYSGGFKARYVEHLNFAGFIYGDHPHAMTPIALSFSRGEFSRGRQYVNAIQLRKIDMKQVPLWAQVWSISVGFRDLGDKKWFGLDPINPEVPYIQQDEAEFFHAAHDELKDFYKKQKLFVDREDESHTEDVLDTTIHEDEEL